MHLRLKHGLLLFCAMFLLGGQACKNTVDPVQQELTRNVVLNIWRPFDGNDAFSKIISKYRSIHPNVRINYRQVRPEIYEEELLHAFAEDRAPDIFAVHNTWVRKYQNKLTPMPAQYQVSTIVPTGDLDGSTVTQVQNKKGYTPRQLQAMFVDVALDAMVIPQDGSARKGNIVSDPVYGVPLGIDTMMLFYNKELLQSAGIALPPKTWAQFQEQVEAVTLVDENFKLVRPGAVIGTANNVPRAADLLSLIMMQAGAQMVDDNGFVTFQNNPPGLQRATPPGIDALRFYIDFSLPVRKAYTWNSLQPDGLEAFIRGNVAFMFGYSYQLPFIRARAPRLALGIAPVPQQLPQQPINFANFWLEGVSAKSETANWAWDFLMFAASEENVKDYLNVTEKPTALLNLMDEQREDLFLGPFVDQLLTSEFWYRGKDGEEADAIMEELITRASQAIADGDDEAFRKAIGDAVTGINQTIR